MTISFQNSSDDSHLAASIEPATTASMVGTNSKAVSCISDVQISSRSHICLGRAPGVWCVVAVHTLLHLCQNTRWSNIRGEYPARGIDIRGLGAVSQSSVLTLYTNSDSMPQSSGVQRPAASERVQKLIADVREFGRWPKRTAHSEEERRLAKRIDYIKNSRDLPHAALEELQALQAEQKASNVAEQKASKVDAVMADVRALGRWPVRHSPSKDPTRESERILAQRVAGLKAEGCLPSAALEELQSLETVALEERMAERVARVMADVRELGRWPVEHSPSKDAARETERLLAKRVGEIKAKDLPSPIAEELEALEARKQHHAVNLTRSVASGGSRPAVNLTRSAAALKTPSPKRRNLKDALTKAVAANAINANTLADVVAILGLSWALLGLSWALLGSPDSLWRSILSCFGPWWPEWASDGIWRSILSRFGPWWLAWPSDGLWRSILSCFEPWWPE